MGKNGGDTPILRGETPKSKIHRKPHRNTLCKAFIGMGSHTKVRFLGGVEPHFLVSILQMVPWVLPRMRAVSPVSHPGQHHPPAPLYLLRPAGLSKVGL